MQKMMTHETPGKVVGLLGAAMLSLAFLFTVTVTDADFGGTASALPDVLSPATVVSAFDSAASQYARAVDTYLVLPAQADYALVSDNVAWIGDNAMDGIAAAFGVPVPNNDVQDQFAFTSHHAAQVAGARTVNSAFNQQTIYNAFQQ